MRRFVSILLAIVMTLSLCACGAKSEKPTKNATVDSAAQDSGESEKVAVVAGNENSDSNKNSGSIDAENNDIEGDGYEAGNASDEEKQMQEDMDELSKIGDVEVENGILTVSITLPAEYAEGVTQEQLDEGKGTTYQSAVLNEDGSVTYKMTKKQHKEMLNSMSDSFDKSIQEMIDDENYSITGITHNDDFTVFDVTLEGTEVGFNDMFTSLTFYMCGGMYGIFSGSKADHVIVNYLDPDGNLIETYDSANMDS